MGMRGLTARPPTPSCSPIHEKHTPSCSQRGTTGIKLLISAPDSGPHGLPVKGRSCSEIPPPPACSSNAEKGSPCQPHIPVTAGT